AGHVSKDLAHVDADGTAGASYTASGLELGRILLALQSEGRGDGIAGGERLRSAEAAIGEERAQARVDAQEIVLERAVGFGGLVHHFDHDNRLVPIELAPPEGSEPLRHDRAVWRPHRARTRRRRGIPRRGDSARSGCGDAPENASSRWWRW